MEPAVTTPHSYDDIARQLAPIAIEAGSLVMGMQALHQASRTKADGTPTCSADTTSESLIVERLRHAFPKIPIISEERIQDDSARNNFFLVDPVDGTAEFIGGGREYCINIALIEKGRPVASVIAAPALNRIWIAGETAYEADIATLDWSTISTSIDQTDRLIALTSSRYGDEETEAYLATLPVTERRLISSAIKFGLIASGEADLYVRLGRTMEWDTAAGDHVLARAGGITLDSDGLPLTYGRRSQAYANGAFMALGNPALAKKIRLPMHGKA